MRSLALRAARSFSEVAACVGVATAADAGIFDVDVLPLTLDACPSLETLLRACARSKLSGKDFDDEDGR